MQIKYKLREKIVVKKSIMLTGDDYPGWAEAMDRSKGKKMSIIEIRKSHIGYIYRLENGFWYRIDWISKVEPEKFGIVSFCKQYYK